MLNKIIKLMVPQFRSSFSGGGGGGGDTTNTTNTIAMPPEFQIPYIENVFENATELYEGGPVQYYPGQTVAGVNPTLQAGFDSVTAPGGAVDYTTDVANMGAGALNQMIQGANPMNNPFFAPTLSAMLQPTVRAFNEDVMPGIDAGAVQAGGYGGSRQGLAQGIATDRLGQNLLNTSLQFGNEAWQTGLDSLGRSILAAPAIQQMGITPSNLLMQTGAAERGIEQEGINAEVDKFNFEQTAPYDALSYYAGLVGNPMGTQGTTTSVTEGGGSTSPVLGAAAGAAAGGAGYMMATGAANAWNPAGWAMMAGGALLGSGIF
jgi:hypothetical protein